MQMHDLNTIPHDLEQLEYRLCQYGSDAVQSEISLNQLFQNHLAAGGTRTRAILALAAGHAVNLPDEVRYIIATAVELLHQASLIHDDIQDRDTLRRGQASVWSVAGDSSAICLGDDLIGAAFQELAKLPAEYADKIPDLINLLAAAISRMAAGQTLDCQWQQDRDTTFSQYEQIVQHKSGPLLGLPIAMVMAIQDASASDIKHVMTGACHIGVAYQLADDLSDRSEDQGTRLNGYWVLASQAAGEIDAEQALRSEFERQLAHARQSVCHLPSFCIQSFEVLIEALHQKYPAFRVAA